MKSQLRWSILGRLVKVKMGKKYKKKKEEDWVTELFKEPISGLLKKKSRLPEGNFNEGVLDYTDGSVELKDLDKLIKSIVSKALG